MTMATEALELGEAEVVIVSYELAGVRGEELLPKGLHATIPTLLTITAWHADGVDAVHLRVSCRAGFRTVIGVLRSSGGRARWWWWG